MDRVHDGQARDGIEQLSRREACGADGSEQHEWKRRGEVWRAAFGRTNACVGALSIRYSEANQGFLFKIFTENNV